MKFSLPFSDKLPKLPNRAMPAIGAPVMVLATLAMVILPIPAFLLDMFVHIKYLPVRGMPFYYRILVVAEIMVMNFEKQIFKIGVEKIIGTS